MAASHLHGSDPGKIYRCGDIIQGIGERSDRVWESTIPGYFYDLVQIEVDGPSVVHFTALNAYPVVERPDGSLIRPYYHGQSTRQFFPTAGTYTVRYVYYIEDSAGTVAYESPILCEDLQVLTLGEELAGTVELEVLQCPDVPAPCYQVGSVWSYLQLEEPSIVRFGTDLLEDIPGEPFRHTSWPHPMGDDLHLGRLTRGDDGLDRWYLSAGEFVFRDWRNRHDGELVEQSVPYLAKAELEEASPEFSSGERLNMLFEPFWNHVTIPDKFFPLAVEYEGFQPATEELSGAGVWMLPLSGRESFSTWQNATPFDPLPAGVYSLKVYITDGFYGSPDLRPPDFRVRVHGPEALSNSMQSEAAPLPPPWSEYESGNYPDGYNIEVLWRSDGETPWYVSIDAMAFTARDSAHAFIYRVTNEKIGD